MVPAIGAKIVILPGEISYPRYVNVSPPQNPPTPAKIVFVNVRTPQVSPLTGFSQLKK